MKVLMVLLVARRRRKGKENGNWVSDLGVWVYKFFILFIFFYIYIIIIIIIIIIITYLTQLIHGNFLISLKPKMILFILNSRMSQPLALLALIALCS